MVISLGGNALFTWLAGTFSGDDPRRYYYAHDTHNLIMYAVVAPAYMAASAAFSRPGLSMTMRRMRSSGRSIFKRR